MNATGQRTSKTPDFGSRVQSIALSACAACPFAICCERFPAAAGFRPGACVLGLKLCLALALGGRAFATENLDRSATTTSLSWTAEFWRNARGGVRRGDWWNALADLTVSRSSTASRIPELVGQIHWLTNRRSDGCFADDVGTINAVSGLMASDHRRVYNLFARWNFGGSHELKIGQIALDDDFMLSSYAGLFANSAFGVMPSQVGTSLSSKCGYTTAFPIYPVAAPGIVFQEKRTEHHSWQLGVYYGGPGDDRSNNYGFSWNRPSHAGVLVFGESAWNYRISTHDAALKLGASFHSDHRENYRAQLDGQDGATTKGLYSIYAIHDVVLASDANGDPKIATFARAGVSPQIDRSVVSTYFDAGVDWFGTFSETSRDTAGVAFSSTHFGGPYRTINRTSATENAVELTYKRTLTAHVSLQADLQYLFSTGSADAAADRRPATVIGLRTAVSF